MGAALRSLAILALTLALATPARAETIVLTSGAFDWVSGRFAADVTMAAPGFSFEGIARPFSGVFNPYWQCNVPECTAGTTVDLFTRVLGTELSGTATYNGVTYDRVGGMDSNSGMDGRWSGNLLIPPGFTGGVLTAPFTFAGTFNIQGSATTSGQIVDLLGGGTARLGFAPSAPFPGTFNLTSVRFEIEAAPVPEPASMLLIGTGLTGLAALRRRRRDNHEA